MGKYIFTTEIFLFVNSFGVETLRTTMENGAIHFEKKKDIQSIQS
jgi:hypothetical protein